MLTLFEISNAIKAKDEHIVSVYSSNLFLALSMVISGALLLSLKISGKENTKVVADAMHEKGWGMFSFVIVFSIILIFRFPFARFYKIVQNARETVRSISSAPELGDIVPLGYTQRVTHLCLAIGRDLNIGESELDSLETACYLHTLGYAVLDKTIKYDDVSEIEASQCTAEIVRRTGGLDRVASIIENQAMPYAGVVNGIVTVQKDPTAAILRIAIDYELNSRTEELFGFKTISALLDNVGKRYDAHTYGSLEKILMNPAYAYLLDPMSFSYAMTEQANAFVDV